MKKIRLNLNRIEIESFPTAMIPKGTGTVEAHLRTRPGDTWCGQDCQTYHFGCFTNLC
ncbi:MAG TPA: hypothetical protein VE871_14625 [Longimicrobium sp.]|nr:hypothetical protein [Longimicrobium sp.]